MPSSTISDIADAKLRRQQERIQQAEAALLPPQQHQRPSSRAKGKSSYKPLDIDWNTSEAQHHQARDSIASTAPGPVSEVRINTYTARPISSRDTSLSRFMSRASRQTGAVELDRSDSLATDDGFQIYRRGRQNKNVEQLKPFEDNKLEQKQKTVEADFDKRQIYEVFAKELPGLDFIDSNLGRHDGQVQFIQHPNGDVSAHIWSDQRTLWENLGNFSNIRKRIEGQLAADRLKGETAWQTLQKHTLAYFRAVAKQREWDAMGVPFGQADLQQILPQPKEAAAGNSKESAALPGLGFTTTNVAGDSASQQHRQEAPIVQPTPRVQGIERFGFMQQQKVNDKDGDPFTAAGPYANLATAPLLPTASQTTSTLPKNVTSQGHNVEQDRLYSSQMPSTSETPTFSLFKPGFQMFNAGQLVPPFNPHPSATLPSMFPFLNPSIGNSFAHDTASRRQTSFDHSGSPSRSKPVTPLQTREAMRDQLWKLGETASARSRNPSQNNIPVRTVLRDPYQRSSGENEASSNSSARAPRDAPSFESKTQQTNSSESAMPTGWMDSQAALPQSRQANPTTSSHQASFDDCLADSVPDCTASPTVASSNGVSTIVPGTEMALVPTSAADFDLDAPPNSMFETRDEALQRWWTSGTKFQRHEELFQSIKMQALLEGSTATTPARTNPRSIGAPPGRTVANPSAGAYQATPQKADLANQPAPFNETVTRAFLLIHENLSSYVQGPTDARQDYWAPWVKAPEWAIDRSAGGNDSFFDGGWGKPPARVGRDPRFRALPGELRFGGFLPGAAGIGSPPGLLGVSGGVPGMARYGYGSPAGKY
ncbi:Hypothetical predicted protein [Lecanosticta acicola]|uniref:Uncharacterized protein n=1 Tax=Lecanosticta acicola TaxID=111012 RepID=A0AAI8W1X5_9PEZI|nr:Hypothetical predicted protein [Lecanosticta acicola]